MRLKIAERIRQEEGRKTQGLVIGLMALVILFAIINVISPSPWRFQLNTGVLIALGILFILWYKAYYF